MKGDNIIMQTNKNILRPAQSSITPATVLIDSIETLQKLLSAKFSHSFDCCCSEHEKRAQLCLQILINCEVQNSFTLLSQQTALWLMSFAFLLSRKNRSMIKRKFQFSWASNYKWKGIVHVDVFSVLKLELSRLYAQHKSRYRFSDWPTKGFLFLQILLALHFVIFAREKLIQYSFDFQFNFMLHCSRGSASVKNCWVC